MKIPDKNGPNEQKFNDKLKGLMVYKLFYNTI